MATTITEESSLDLFRKVVIQIGGLEGWRALQEIRGGSEVYIPRKPRPRCWIVQALGQEMADRICSELWQFDADDKPVPYGRVLMPLGVRGSWFRISKEAEKLLLKGLSVRQIVGQLGVSERTVWRIRALLVEAGRLRSAR